MKRNLEKEIKKDENKINEGIVGIEEKIQNNKKIYYLTIGGVIVALAVFFGILAGTGVI